MQVTICGGGNSAHVAAGYLAAKGHTVNVLTTKPEKWSTTVTVTTATSVWKERGNFVGKLNRVSGKAKDVIPGSEVRRAGGRGGAGLSDARDRRAAGVGRSLA
jgi:hypothetical protein